MLTDSSALPEGHTLEADVCVIGSGPAGMTVALELMRHHVRVLLVEAGGEDGQTRAPAARGVTEGWPFPDLEDTRAVGLGGTTAQWTPQNRWSQVGMSSRPLDAIDFESRAWVPHSGWPFGLDHLRPFYARAQALCGIGAFDYEVPPAADRRAGEPLAPASHRLQTTLIRWTDPKDVRAHGKTLSESPDVTVLLHARAIEIETADAGHVSRIRLRGSGRELWATARFFVMATGGVENARLLLLSDRTYPAGLGNGNDLVGRYFMDHVTFNRGVIRPRTPDFYRGLELYRRHTIDGVPVSGALSLREAVRRDEELLTVLFLPFVGRRQFGAESVRSFATLVSSLRQGRRPRRLTKTLRDVASNPLDVIQASYLVLSGADLREPGYFGLLPHLEQAPQPDNRVTLADKRDELGLRLPRLHWQLGDTEWRSLQRTAEIVGAELDRDGTARLEFQMSRDEFRRLAHVSHHHMGTTRMHDDPKHGVVDADCRVHGVSNLFIAGSSVLPTGGGATVTLTAMALALRLAEHLRSRLMEAAQVSV